MRYQEDNIILLGIIARAQGFFEGYTATILIECCTSKSPENRVQYQAYKSCRIAEYQEDKQIDHTIIRRRQVDVAVMLML